METGPFYVSTVNFFRCRVYVSNNKRRLPVCVVNLVRPSPVYHTERSPVWATQRIARVRLRQSRRVSHACQFHFQSIPALKAVHAVRWCCVKHITKMHGPPYMLLRPPIQRPP